MFKGQFSHGVVLIPVTINTKALNVKCLNLMFVSPSRSLLPAVGFEGLIRWKVSFSYFVSWFIHTTCFLLTHLILYIYLCFFTPSFCVTYNFFYSYINKVAKTVWSVSLLLTSYCILWTPANLASTQACYQICFHYQ